MHEDRLSTAIRNAGEAFEPPWLDVRSITKRGRRRWWLTRAVAVASLTLAGAGAAVVTQLASSGQRMQPATGRLTEWVPLAGAPVAGRAEPSAVWTGRELIVSGGYPVGGRRAFVDGAAYDPARDSWRSLPSAPEAVRGHSTVWTGREMLVWGGEPEDWSTSDYTGYSFDPASGRWTPLPRAPRGSLGGHTALWTGTEMLVWGGVRAGPSPGLRYEPRARRWSTFSEGPLGNRHAHDAVWTGEEMIVWGGGTQDGTPTEGPEGAAFDPETGTWRALPDSPLDPVYAPVSVWTGSEMLVVGGLGQEVPPRSGAAYDPATDRWRAIADAPVAEARGGAPTPLTDLHTTAVWTGREAVFVTADGILTYRPDEDRWTTAGAPGDARRLGATTVWTGDALIVWSGRTWDVERYATGGWTGRY